MRRDASFHDGTPVKAQDVKWSFDRFVKAGGFPQRQMEQGSLTSVDQFEAVDDYTFRVKFLRADKLTMPSLAIVVPSVYNSELCKKNATASDPWALEWTKNNCAGSGAFKVESFKSSEQVVLASFDGWKGGTPPKFQRAMYRNVAAAGDRGARWWTEGDADLSPDLPPREIADISATKKFRVESRADGEHPQVPGAVDDHQAVRRCARSPGGRLRHPLPEGDRQCGVRTRATNVRRVRGGADHASWPQPFPYKHDPDKAKALLRDAVSHRASKPNCSSTRKWPRWMSRPRSSSRTSSARSESDID